MPKLFARAAAKDDWIFPFPLDTWERRAIREAKVRHSAEDRAERLLIAYMTPAQRKSYACSNSFIVQGPSGRRYSITAENGLLFNIHELAEDGQVRLLWCAHAELDMPLGDHLLTQKLMLEHHEQEFRRIANCDKPNQRWSIYAL